MTVRADCRRNGARRALTLAPLCLAFALAACLSEDPNAWYNKTVAENVSGRSQPPSGANAPAPAGSQVATAAPQTAVAAASPAAPIGVAAEIRESELYRSEASCGGVALGSARPLSVPTDAISLGMTECDVARRAGAPDKIEIGTGERGEPLLVMTYARGERPRIYRFAAGRLVAIEALAPQRLRPSPPRRSAAPG
jgi:hypothetical protein